MLLAAPFAFIVISLLSEANTISPAVAFPLALRLIPPTVELKPRSPLATVRL